MIVAEGVLAGAHGVIQRDARGDEFALHLHDRADVAVNQPDVEVVGAVMRLEDHHGLVKGVEGFVQVAHLLVGVAQVVPQ